MAYTIELSPAAERQLKALPTSLQKRLVQRLLTLETEPRPSGIKKLDAEIYRLRVGDYRLIYQVQDQALLILVLKVGHRKDIYRR
jgi:mRNA interferase RelE/StbE